MRQQETSGPGGVIPGAFDHLRLIPYLKKNRQAISP